MEGVVVFSIPRAKPGVVGDTDAVWSFDRDC